MRILTLLFFFIWATASTGQRLALRQQWPVKDAASFQFTSLSGELMVARNNKQAILFSADGKIVLDSTLRSIDFAIADQRILATKMVQGAEKSGYLTADGQVAIPFQLEKAVRFKFGYATALQNGTPVLLDTLGAITDFKKGFNGLEVVKPGVLQAKSLRNSVGLIRIDGSEIYPQGPHILNLAGAYFEVNGMDANWKLYQHFRDYDGNKLEGPIPEPLPPTPPYLARKVYSNSTVYALKDSISGALLTGFDYKTIKAKSFGWLSFQKSSYTGRMTVGYMNFRGQTVLERAYAEHNPLSAKDILFYSDLSRGPWRWYDENGRTIFAEPIKKMEVYFHTNTVAPFDTAGIEGLAVSLKGDKLGLYNRAGQMIVAEQFDSMVYLSRTHLWFKQGKQSGIIDAKGTILPNQSYDKIFRTGYFGPDGLPLLRIYSNKSHGFITQTGKELIAPSAGIVSHGYSDFQGNKYLWTFNGKSIDIYEILPEVSKRKQ